MLQVSNLNAPAFIRSEVDVVGRIFLSTRAFRLGLPVVKYPDQRERSQASENRSDSDNLLKLATVLAHRLLPVNYDLTYFSCLIISGSSLGFKMLKLQPRDPGSNPRVEADFSRFGTPAPEVKLLDFIRGCLGDALSGAPDG